MYMTGFTAVQRSMNCMQMRFSILYVSIRKIQQSQLMLTKLQALGTVLTCQVFYIKMYRFISLQRFIEFLENWSYTLPKFSNQQYFLKIPPQSSTLFRKFQSAKMQLNHFSPLFLRTNPLKEIPKRKFDFKINLFSKNLLPNKIKKS